MAHCEGKTLQIENLTGRVECCPDRDPHSIVQVPPRGLQYQNVNSKYPHDPRDDREGPSSGQDSSVNSSRATVGFESRKVSSFGQPLIRHNGVLTVPERL